MKAVGLPVAIVLALAGCGVSPVDGVGDDGGIPGTCSVALASTPREPVAGPAAAVGVVATASDPSRVLDYGWRVRRDGAPVDFTRRPGGDGIDFVAALPGVYEVALDPGAMCTGAALKLNARARGARTQSMRLRVVPARDADAPVHEELTLVYGGAPADLDVLTLDAGVVERISVTFPGGTGVPAYLRFAPLVLPDAIVEGFSDTSGTALVRMARQPYTVLVVPSVTSAMPRRFTSWMSGRMLLLDGGSPLAGTVRDPRGAPLVGASVQFAIDGVPSTVATTTADGVYALRAATWGVNLTVTVEVVPPAGSGLPRLSATWDTSSLSLPVDVQYASNVMLTDLTGTVVKRGAPVPGARLEIVGSIEAVGTVTGGGANPATATGEVRIAVTAGTTGALPATLVPAIPLTAVIEVAPGDLAATSFDATAGAPAVLVAAPPSPTTTAIVDAHGARLPGATLELVPIGALAMAGAPTRRFSAGGDGTLAASLSPGGHYELRFHDPMGRAAPLVIADAATLAPMYRLPAAVRLSGVLHLLGQPLPDASVQILCDDGCSGVARAKPLVEVVSDAAGRFTLAVPDPGTE